MGLKDRVVDKAAGDIAEKSSELFKRLIEIQESMHAHLEKILEVQRAMYNYMRVKDKMEEIDWKDTEQ